MYEYGITLVRTRLATFALGGVVSSCDGSDKQLGRSEMDILLWT